MCIDADPVARISFAKQLAAREIDGHADFAVWADKGVGGPAEAKVAGAQRDVASIVDNCGETYRCDRLRRKLAKQLVLNDEPLQYAVAELLDAFHVEIHPIHEEDAPPLRRMVKFEGYRLRCGEH
ncbi:hypothetical protein AWB81_08027 [Caballeronia arationis]|nr:hypothetical protein AWB81_08027 [Caballeronia arationis]